MAVRVCPAHNGCDRIKRGGRQTKFGHEGVKATRLAVMAKADILDIKRRRAEFLSNEHHILRRDKQELRMRINKAPYEPRASDTINLWPVSSDPNGSALIVTLRKGRSVHQWTLGVAPCELPALQNLGFDASIAKNRHCPL